jgi:hypothetical protein
MARVQGSMQGAMRHAWYSRVAFKQSKGSMASPEMAHLRGPAIICSVEGAQEAYLVS